MIFTAIANWAKEKEFPVKFMCTQLDVTEQGYYQHLKRGASLKVLRDAELENEIRNIYEGGKRPGVRMVFKELIARGYFTSHKRVARIMSEAGLAGRYVKAYKVTTVPDGSESDIPDLVKRNFFADSQDEVWVGDISYIRTYSGFKYFATVIDLYSRRVVGYAVSNTMTKELVCHALTAAVKVRRPEAGVIFHHDAGSQYTSKDFRRLCALSGVIQSCGSIGSCFDNAVAESFFATIKKELIYTRPWVGLNDLKAGIIEWIEHHYNTKRRHSYLGYLTPSEYELGYRSVYELAA